MGRAKQLLPLGGKPLLQHVVDAAADSCVNEIVLVLGPVADEIEAALTLPPGKRVRVVVNADPTAGLSSSLRLGVRGVDARAAALAVLLGDQPGVSAALIDRVAAAFVAGDRPVARPVYRHAAGGPVPGHPVFVARELWTEVEALTGDEGLRTLLARRPGCVLEVPLPGEPPADIDTRADYDSAVDRHGGAR
jgi:molybdenum cofactor cytidylyltransferase